MNIDIYDVDERLAVPLPELVTDPALPPLDAPLSQVSDGVAVTADGWIILAEGSAVIGPDDVVVVGEQLSRNGVDRDPDAVRRVPTPAPQPAHHTVR